MTDKPISFRVCDFSEQLIRNLDATNVIVYSAVMHVDGKVFHVQRDLRVEFCPPIASLRADAWLELLRQVAEQPRG